MVFLFLILFRSPFYLNPRLVMAIMALAFTGLSLVFFFEKINNTSRWIRFAGLSIQPSEFAKIALVLYLAMMLSRKDADINNLKNLGLILLPVAFMEGLDPQGARFRQLRAHRGDHHGHAVRRRRAPEVFRWSSSLLLIPLLVLLIRADPMRQERINSFLNPESYAATHGFQALQSTYAIGSGGLFGQGIGNSTQKLFLPALCLLGLHLCHHRRGAGVYRRPGGDRPVCPLLPARHGHRPAIGQPAHLPAGDRPGLS